MSVTGRLRSHHSNSNLSISSSDLRTDRGERPSDTSTHQGLEEEGGEERLVRRGIEGKFEVQGHLFLFVGFGGANKLRVLRNPGGGSSHPGHRVVRWVCFVVEQWCRRCDEGRALLRDAGGARMEMGNCRGIRLRGKKYWIVRTPAPCPCHTPPRLPSPLSLGAELIPTQLDTPNIVLAAAENIARESVRAARRLDPPRASAAESWGHPPLLPCHQDWLEPWAM